MNERHPINEGKARVTGTRRSGSERRRSIDPDVLRAEGYLIEIPEADEHVHPRSFFGNDSPVELEIGCGKGAFLVHAAEACPGVNYIGVEIALPFVYSAAARVSRRGFPNAKVVCADGGRLVRERLEPECLAAVHVFFPDPWPKKRHQKRRLFTAEFVRGVHRVLVPGGVLCLATDFVDYYQSMRSLMDSDGSFERLLAYEWHGGGGITNFERKYLLEGRTSHRASYRKRAVSEEARRI